MKIPAKSIAERHDRSQFLDREAMRAAANIRPGDSYVGQQFTVPAFCREMARLLAEEERETELRKVAPLFARTHGS